MSGMPRFLNREGKRRTKYTMRFCMIPFLLQPWSTSYTRQYTARQVRKQVKFFYVKPTEKLMWNLQRLSGCKEMVVRGRAVFRPGLKPYRKNMSLRMR